MTTQGLTLELRAGAAPAFAGAELLFDDVAGIASRAAFTGSAEWQQTAPDAGVLTIPALAVRLACRSTAT